MSTESEHERRRQQLYGLLGDLPERNRPICARLVHEEQRDNYHLERLVLDLNGIEDVPAHFCRPRSGKGPWPTILYNHAHGGKYELGKEELISGRPSLQEPPYADELTARGYCVLCIDTWVFGERHCRQTESETFKLMLWQGRVLWGMMVYDSLRALDYLESRREVDAARIATMGLSMGSTMAWWLAALDTRIKVCVDLCCLTDFDALIADGGLDRHGLYYYVPGLLKHFSVAQINELIVPRAHLGLAGNLDSLTPVVGLLRIDKHLAECYARAGAPQAWKLFRQDVGHCETPEMRREVLAYLERWL